MKINEINKLINEISKLPGLGRRSAQRIALHLIKDKEKFLLPLITTLKESNEKIINCDLCGNIDIISFLELNSFLVIFSFLKLFLING